MLLFNHLHERFFVPLSRGNIKLHEECLLEIYKLFYENDQAFPRKEDMLLALCEVIARNPDLWFEEPEEIGEQGGEVGSRPKLNRKREDESLSRHPAIARARKVYRLLCETGWFAEMVYGLQTHTELSPQAQALMQTLVRIHRGISEEMDGTLQTLNAVLGKLANGEDQFASGLASCLKLLQDFRKSLRATHSDMSRIREEVLKGKTVGERIDTLMQRFVNEVLVKDFKQMMSNRHPYLMRAETSATIRTFMSDRGKMRKIGEELAARSVQKSLDQLAMEERELAIDNGTLLAEQQFSDIEDCLEQITLLTNAIMEAKSKLEEQLRIQARHQHRMRPQNEELLEEMIEAVGTLIAQSEDVDALCLPNHFIDRPPGFSERALWEPAAPRRKVAAVTAKKQVIDRLATFRSQLDDEFLNRIIPDDNALGRFIERALGDANTVELNDDILADVDDYMASSAVLTLARGDEMPTDLERLYAIEPVAGVFRTKYAESPGYKIARKTPAMDLKHAS